MKRLSWKYIAGLLDGEGCIDIQYSYTNEKAGYSKAYFNPRIRVHLTGRGKDVIAMLHAQFGGYIGVGKQPKNPNWSLAHQWEICGFKRVCIILRNVVNHLIIKKEEARLVLWMETNLKGKKVSEEARQFAIDELKAMKRDPQRLSERAQEQILLRCDSPATLNM